MKPVWIYILVTGMALQGVSVAMAHGVKCFASADGNVISGYAWMASGARPQNVPFKVLTPDGRILHEGLTNEKGEFTFSPVDTCDHVVVVDAGEGHTARFAVKADELPGAPPRRESPAQLSAALPGKDVELTSVKSAASLDELENTVDRVVSRRIAPLRRELAASESRRRLQDVVAGLGYIAGLAGAAFFFMGSRRNKA